MKIINILNKVILLTLLSSLTVIFQTCLAKAMEEESTHGISTRLSTPFWKDTIPTLSPKSVEVCRKLNTDELGEIEAYFTPEVVKIANERRIFSQVLQRILRRIEFRSIKRGPEGLVLVNNYVDCTADERRRVMSALTPDYLRRSASQQFFTLVEDMDAMTLNLNSENSLREFLTLNNVYRLMPIIYRAPIRWYPLLRLALILNEVDFNKVIATESSQWITPEHTSDDEGKLIKNEFPNDSKFQETSSDVDKFIGYLGHPMDTRQVLRLTALIYYEPTEHNIPRLRSPSEVKTLVDYLQGFKFQKWSAEDYLSHLSIVPSSRLKNEFWTDVGKNVSPRKMEVFKRQSSEELEAVEKFFTPEKERIARANDIYYQIMERFAGHTSGAGFSSSTAEENRALMTLLTDQFIEVCPKGKFSKLARVMGEMTLTKAGQIILLLREEVLKTFPFKHIVKSVCIIPGSCPPSTFGMIFPTDEERGLILLSLSDEFFRFVPDLGFFHDTLRTLHRTPTVTHPFIMGFLMNGFSHEWVERIILFGSFDCTPTPQPGVSNDTTPRTYIFKRIIDNGGAHTMEGLCIDETRSSLLNFLMRLNGLGFKTKADVEAILGTITPPLYKDENYYQAVARNVLDFLSEDVLRVLQTSENIIRYITLIYREPAPYLELRERLIEEVTALIAFLSPDKIVTYTNADDLLKYVKNLRYKDGTFHTATPDEKPDLSSSFNKYMLDHRADRWFFEG